MEPRFSQRTSWDTAETEWARLLRERRLTGLPIFDLTASNPTRAGFAYDESLLRPLLSSAALEYEPNPKGLRSAREAIAAYYAGHGAVLDPEQVLLTTSTSEAYSFVFRLLCNPGDEVLIAQPSYPLFDFLAALDDVRLVPYPLFYDYGWHLDEGALRQKITSRTRAIALVHPNNPTGHFTKPEERKALEAICVEHGLTLIVDEVFLDYAVSEGPTEESFASGEHPVLTFVLSGLSKIAGLPQMKAAWLACFGPQPTLLSALDRLDVIADTFLSMNAPVQAAIPFWLSSRSSIQQQIGQRIKANLDTLDAMLAKSGVIRRLAIEAGWYAVLRIPAHGSDEETACRLIREHGVAIHSGEAFGFDAAGWLVASLLPTESEFKRALEYITAEFETGPTGKI
ncbi:Aspartate aminotransferase [Acidisarcina polymorpha]|uniref:alanine transaminase n=1 Tax=Acidisarcina polymorpha TaxID=2211140 RepID=A0A2Z5FRV3_9BACT|nr:pyridoxal phosphate-dependent aminotransferase [Acidisarcina polymorpha]AXC09420.1 Aspartate aminotransferase [Acidisarcina polymorpha]